VLFRSINTHSKSGVVLDYCRTRFAIMNPELTYTVPPFQTGSGTTDVLAHAFDSYFTYGDSYLADKFCESTMCAAVKYGPIALKDPTNYEARAELMLTSSFSHNDTCRIGRDRTLPRGGGHNLENMSSLFDVTHGAGLAVTMPAFLQYLVDSDETTLPKIAQFANRVFNVECDPRNLGEVAQEGINRFRNWLKLLGMPATLNELIHREITDVEIDKLVGNVRFNKEGVMHSFGHLTKEDVQDIYQSMR
jgi:alcohol dehydrogenase YqhD (iron-dependent ADH family)